MKITFVIDGETWGRVVIFLAIVWTIAATAAMTLGAVLYNLIADLVGGVELTVLEETYAQQQVAPGTPVRAARPRGLRREPARRPVATNGSTVPTAKPAEETAAIRSGVAARRR